MIEFYWPTTGDEWLAFGSAGITIVFGLICLLTPRTALAIMRLQTRPDVPQALSESRATMAGFYLGVGITAVLFNQPFIWMALAAGWGFTAAGRLVSMIFDRGFTSFNVISIAIEAGLAVCAAAPVIGLL